ncbi:MAG: ATP-dependent DNA helicase RecG, partial [Planktothrix sp.]
MKSYQPDWWRFSKALCVEAERGFTNLQGSQYQFHEFFYVSLKELFENAPPETQQRCQDLAEEFLRYPELAVEDRQHLIADTRRFLLQLQRLFECRNKVSEIREQDQKQNRQPLPNTSTIKEQAKVINLSLEQSLEKIIGPRNSDRIAKLGILTVFDLLYYYPRDHIDYARQVKIKELEPGETVTLIAQVKRCSCFSSPRNKKLTILELVLSDNTGQLKISRFYAGNRYSSKGWQHQQKNNYA